MLGVMNLRYLVKKRNEAHYDLVCALGFPVEYNTLFEPAERKIMPSNDININNGLHYIVQDTDMDELMAWLDKHNIGVDCTGSEDDEATA